MDNLNENLDKDMINIIDQRLMEVEQDEEKGIKWLSREETDKLMIK